MLVLVCRCILCVVYARYQTYVIPLCILLIPLLVYRDFLSVSSRVYTHFYTPINSNLPIGFYLDFTPILLLCAYF